MHLVHLNADLVVVLEALIELFPLQSFLTSNALKHLQNARHHALETAEVHDGTILEEIEYLISVLLNLVLDVHLATLAVVLLTRKCIVNAELIRVGRDARLDFIVIQLSIGVGNTHEKPSQTGELVVGHVLEEHAAPESAERRNASTSGNHDDHSVGVLGEEENLAGGSSHGDLLSWLSIAQKVGADALLGRVLGIELRAPVSSPANAERCCVSIEVVTVASRGDGIKASAVGNLLTLGVDLGARGDDTIRLALNKGDLLVSLNDNVAGLAGGLGANDALHGHNLSGKGVLGAKCIHGQANLLQLEGDISALDLQKNRVVISHRANAVFTATSAEQTPLLVVFQGQYRPPCPSTMPNKATNLPQKMFSTHLGSGSLSTDSHCNSAASGRLG